MNWKMKDFMALTGVISFLVPVQSAWALSAVLVKDAGYGELNIGGGYFQSGDSSGRGAVFIGIDNATVETTGRSLRFLLMK